MANPMLAGLNRSLMGYLGHFAKEQFLRAGHNTGEPGGDQPATLTTWNDNAEKLRDETGINLDMMEKSIGGLYQNLSKAKLRAFRGKTP